MVIRHIRRHPHLWRDLGLLGLSLAIAIILAQTGTIAKILTASQASVALGSFVTGFFLVFIFTVAPSVVALVELAEMGHSAWTVVAWATLGNVIGDLVIFKFIRDSLADDIFSVIQNFKGVKRLRRLAKIHAVRFFMPILGAIIVASPLPDEAGITLLGLSKMKMRFFIPLVLLIDFVGIWILFDLGLLLIK